MPQFSEAYGSLDAAINDVLRTAEGVPAHIKADILMRHAGQQTKLAEASNAEAAGQAIKNDPVNQREQVAASPTDAAPIVQDGKKTDASSTEAKPTTQAAK